MATVPICHVTLKAQKPLKSTYPMSLITIGDHIKKRRLTLNLYQKDVATQIGVTEEAVYNWENNHKKPKVHLLPKIIEFLGYVPFNSSGSTIVEKMVTYRKKHGLSQRKLAEFLKIDKTTIRDWEINRQKPSRKLSEMILRKLL